MRLTGEAARQWLAQNPNASYTDNRTGQKTTSQPGFFSKLASTVTQPFRRAAGITQEFGMTLADLVRAARGEESLERPEQYALLSPEESEELYRDPLRTGLKSAAGVMSYAIPGGGGAATSTLGRIGTATTRGAGAGALGSFGYSKEGKELESTLKGGALGGLLGGALQGVGEVAKAIKGDRVSGKVKEFGLETRGKAIGLDANKLASRRGANVSSMTQGKKAINNYFNTVDELGLPTSTSEIASQSSDQALDILNSQFDDILSRADDTISFTAKDSKNLLNKMDTAFAGNKNILNNAQYLELKAKLTNLGNNYTPSALNSVREEARNLVNWASSNKAAVSERATKQVFNTIDDFFKSRIPESSTILSKAKDIYTVRPFFQAKAPGAGAVKVGTASTNIAIPSGAIQERIPETIGRGLQQGVRMPSGISKAVSAATPVAQRTIPAISALLQPTQQAEEEQVQTPEYYQYEQEPQIDQMALVQAVLNGQLSTSEADWIMEMLAPTTQQAQPKTETGRKAMVARDAAVEALNIVSSEPGVTGKTQGIENIISEITGVANVSTEYKQLIDKVRSQIFNILGGASLTPNEQKQYEKFLPKYTDSAERARQKLQSLIPMLESLMGVEQESASTALSQLGIGQNY